MKVLLVVTDFGVFGGGERVASNLARMFEQAHGHTVDLLSFQELAESTPFDQQNELTKKSLNLNLYRNGLLHRIIAKFHSLIRLRRLLREGDWHVVIAIGTYPSIMLGLSSVGKAIRIGCEHASLLATPWGWSVLRRCAYPKLDHLVVLTKRAATVAQKLNRNISVIANSLSEPSARLSEFDHHRVLGIGRLDENKNFGVLIEAFSEAVKEHPSWDLCIIGDGDQEQYLRRKISSLGLDRSVSIRPSVLEVQAEYMNSGIVALTSLSEGLPMVLLEAQSVGIPCIAFDCDTGPAEIVEDGQTGFLITPGDVSDFSRKLSKLMGDQSLRRRMSAVAIKNAERFSDAVIGEKWQMLFAELHRDLNSAR